MEVIKKNMEVWREKAREAPHYDDFNAAENYLKNAGDWYIQDIKELDFENANDKSEALEEWSELIDDLGSIYRDIKKKYKTIYED